MTLIVDAAPIIAAADLREPSRTATQRVLRAERGSIIIPAPVTAEVDYLLQARLGDTPLCGSSPTSPAAPTRWNA